MGKAIIYVRVSTVDKQTNDRQIEELKIKAQKDGYDQKDIIIYQDKISGYIKGENRPALSELMNVIRAETELYTMIYIHEISRLGRNPDHVQQLLSEISELQIPIFIKSIEKYTIVDGKRDSFTNIIINILSEFAHQEAEYTKMRFKSGLISGARRGRVGGGKMYAYGFKNDNQMLVADEDESIIIKKVFDLYQQGTGSKQIANFLNNNNVPTRTNKALEGKTITYKKLGFEKKAKDVKWSDTQIISILSNPIYKGERRFTGERIPIGAIITTEQFDDCTNIRTTKVSRDYVVKYDYLLKDLQSDLFCKIQACPARRQSIYVFF
jgi:site-specific DNA recombinase